MKPETAQYLDKAQQALSEARAVAGIELAEAAGRAAYLAAFHAEQALIFERNGKVPKTHRYTLTHRGSRIITALLAARQASTEKLTALAA